MNRITDLRIVSKNVQRREIPYTFLVRAVHKSRRGKDRLVEVVFGGSDVIHALCNPYKAAARLVEAEMPNYFLPQRQEWYLEDRTEAEF